MKTRAAALAIALVVASIPTAAQWKNISKEGLPLGPDGKVNMSAPAPRTASGRPDLSGIYQSSYRYFANLAADLGLDKVPMTDEARKIHTARATGLLGYEEPDAHCLPQGVPKVNMAPVPFRIVQTEKLVVLVYEAFNLWRQVHLDGRDWADDLNPSWMGYSKGRWEGDALVVETTNFREGGWLDVNGAPLTEQGKITERFRRPTFGTLEIDVTIDDPKAYTKPWTVRVNQRLLVDTELIEFVCNENQQFNPATGSRLPRQ
jgi:hypothetical protein